MTRPVQDARSVLGVGAAELPVGGSAAVCAWNSWTLPEDLGQRIIVAAQAAMRLHVETCVLDGLREGFFEGMLNAVVGDGAGAAAEGGIE